MYAEERRAKILKWLDQRGTVNSTDLAHELKTSRETVRRDIIELSKQGLLVKTHGGAITTGNGDVLLELPFSLRETRSTEEKKRMCAFAATLLHEADTIFIDNSTSCSYLVRYIPKSMRLTILTNSLRILLDSMKYNVGNWNVLCTGGKLMDKTMSLNNYVAVNTLAQFNPNKAFMSCHCISPQLKVLDHYIDDIEIKRQVLKNAKRSFLLADHTKANNTGVVEIADISAFQHVITDTKMDAAIIRDIRSREIFIDPV